jgi:hypothetical protein
MVIRLLLERHNDVYWYEKAVLIILSNCSILFFRIVKAFRIAINPSELARL